MKLILLKHLLAATVGSLAIAGIASAQTVGVDFYNAAPGSSTGQTPTAAAGPVPTTAWNEYSLSAFSYNAANGGYTSLALTDSASAAAGSVSFTEGGTALNGHPINNSNYGAAGSANSALTDNQQLYNGAAQANSDGQPSQYAQQVNLTNIPYSSFSVYVLVTAPVGNQGYGNAGYYDETSLQMFTGTGESATGGVTYYLGSSNQALPTTFQQVTSTSVTAPTLEGNYVLFSGLTGGDGSSYSFDLYSPYLQGQTNWFGGDGFIGGVEVVADAPEPSTYALMFMGLGFLVMVARRRRVS